MAVDELALLRLELETLWVTDDAGRLRHCRTADEEPAPLLVVAACDSGLTWATSVAVPATAAAAIGAILEDEPPADAIGWAPSRADALLWAVDDVGELSAAHGGPSYVVPSGPRVPAGLDLRSSASTDLADLQGLLPEADRSLTAPWAMAMVDGRPAAVCETARSAPASTEAGVWTYEPYRRQGLAAAVTAAWSRLLGGRLGFYSTSWDNVASQGVARHLGLRPLGQWWQLSAR